MQLRTKNPLVSANLITVLVISAFFQLTADDAGRLIIPNRDGQSGLYVDSITFAEDNIVPGSTQHIQSLIVNKYNRPFEIVSKIRVKKPKGELVFLPEQKGIIQARSIRPFIFDYVIDPNEPGIYFVEAYVVRDDTNEVIYKTSFTVWFFNALQPDDDDPLFASGLAARDNLNPALETPPEVVEGDGSGLLDNTNPNQGINSLPNLNDSSQQTPGLLGPGIEGLDAQNNGSILGTDGLPGGSNISGSVSGDTTTVTQSTRTGSTGSELGWRDFRLLNESILRGEPNIIRGFLINDGREITKNANYSFFLVNENNEENYKNEPPIFTGSAAFIAPGESKLLEIYVNIPQSKPVGKYKVVAIVDENNLINELDESNNTFISRSFDFNDISPLEPAEGQNIGINSLITFAWRSLQFNRFNVEVSNNPEFEAQDQIIRFPNDEPTPLSTLTLLESEMELLREFASTALNNTVYWRVTGADGQGRQTRSIPKPMIILNNNN